MIDCDSSSLKSSSNDFGDAVLFRRRHWDERIMRNTPFHSSERARAHLCRAVIIVKNYQSIFLICLLICRSKIVFALNLHELH